MALINPHILFKGNTLEAFEYYRSVFGGEFTKIIRLKDLPVNPQYPVTESAGNKIVHIGLPIGNAGMLMGSDVAEQFMDHELITGNRYTISIKAQSKEEADRLFEKLSAGGEVEMPLEESLWGTSFAMFSDKYGIQWMLDYDPANK